jgi:hypothetical protein
MSVWEVCEVRGWSRAAGGRMLPFGPGWRTDHLAARSSTADPRNENFAMRCLTYAMRFTGRVTLASADGMVLEVAATAPSASLTATVGPAGLASDRRPADGDEATFASEVTITGATSFQEVGTIVFGDGHRLRFSTIGSGYLGGSGDPARKHGTAMWRVEGGEGQFAGASGLISSNFFVDDEGEITDHQLGVILLK